MALSSSSPPAGSEVAPAESREARQRIEEEHRKLNELMRQIRHTTEIGRLQVQMAALETLLVEHFAGEEGPQGMHEVVGEGASHRLPNLQHLFEEHREMLAAVAKIRADVDACLNGPVRAVLAEVAALDATLQRHEAEEDNLFSEAFYLDIGGRA